MRQCLAVLFLMIFTFQALPMKGISKLLCKAQNTEDVQDNNADDDDATGMAALYSNDIILSHFTFDTQAGSHHYFEHKVSVTIRDTKALPFVCLTRIPSPPPDFI